MVEPFGVFPHPGVVGGAVQGVVHGQFHPVLFDGLDQEIEVVEIPEGGVEGREPTFLRADGPRATWVSLPGEERIILSFAECVPNRVNGRDV